MSAGLPYRRKEIIGNCTLFLGDCRDILPTLGKVDAVVTDPPYGIGYPYAEYVDSQENLLLLIAGFMPVSIASAKRVVVTPGVSNLHSYPQPDWIGAWTWETTATYGKLGYNQWQPILFYGEEMKGFGSINGTIKSDRIHFSGGAAKISHDTDGLAHTCPKPYAFVRRLINRFTWEGETVVDPFLGSGTTGVACVKLGRKFIGIEIDEGYFDIACERIRKAYAQPDMFIAPPIEKPKQEAML